MKPEKQLITLCGSTRFENEFMYVAEQLAVRGNVVLMPDVFSKTSGAHIDATLLQQFIDKHFEKIAASDKIFVINKHQYIGHHTQAEIAYAKSLNIPVEYLEPLIKNEA